MENNSQWLGRKGLGYAFKKGDLETWRRGLADLQRQRVCLGLPLLLQQVTPNLAAQNSATLLLISHGFCRSETWVGLALLWVSQG